MIVGVLKNFADKDSGHGLLRQFAGARVQIRAIGLKLCYKRLLFTLDFNIARWPTHIK